MMDKAPDDEHRCLSSTEIEPGQLKRCIKPLHHLVDEFVGCHIWVEAGNASDSHRLIVEWDDQQKATFIVYQRRSFATNRGKE